MVLHHYMTIMVLHTVHSHSSSTFSILLIEFIFDSSMLFQIREEPPPYTPPVMERYESFENPLAGSASHSYGSQDTERSSSGKQQFGTALYDFTAGGDDEVD